MTAKSDRHAAIADIVRRQRPRTQAELAEALAAGGHEATQATVSRDIGEMGITKGPGGYLLASEARLVRLLADMVVSLETADNLVVVKAIVGGAQGVAAAIDAAGIGDVMGSIAGDDTILVIARDTSGAQRFVAELETYRRM